MSTFLINLPTFSTDLYDQQVTTTIENNAYTESTIASALATTWIPQVINVQSGQFDIVMVPTGKPQWLLHNSFLNIRAKFDLHITIKK